MNSAAPPSDCNAHDRAAYGQLRRQSGLTGDQMGLFDVFGGAGSLFVGFFATGFLYERIVLLAPETRLLELTLIVVALSLPLLSLTGAALGSEWMYAEWRDNEEWGGLLLQCGALVRTTCLFLCTHFVLGLLVGLVTTARCSVLECLALIPAVIVLFYFFSRMLKPSAAVAVC